MENNTEQLRKLAKVFNTDNVITSAEIEQVLTGILSIMASFRKENIQLTEDNRQLISDLMSKVETEYQKTLDTIDTKEKTLSDNFSKEIGNLQANFQKELAQAKELVKELKSIEVKDGKDADEEKIVQDVLAQIKLPEYKEVILDDGEEIANKLEALEGEAKLDFKALKNVPVFKGGGLGGVVARNIYQMGDVSLTSLANNDVLKWDDTNKLWVNGVGGAGASPLTTKGDIYTFTTVDARLGVGANGEVLTADSSTATGLKWAAVTGTGTVTDVLVVSANGFAGTVATSTTTPAITLTTSVTGLLKGNGTAISAATAGTDYQAAITGSDTQVLFFDGANNPAGEAGMTYDKTNDALTVAGRIITPEVKAVGSAGVDIHNNSGTQVALFGAGGGTGSSLFGTTNIGSASADYIQVAGGTGSTTLTATGSSTDIDITAVPKGAGKFKVTGNANISGLTASQIMATNASKDLVSLDTATYPSLTELSYVKGVTSAIQTQLNGKANTSGALTQFLGNGNWKVWYSDGSGDVQELALGASGTYLKSNGASSAPSFDTPSGGSGVDYGSPTYTVWGQQDFISSSWSGTDSPFSARNSGAGSGIGGPATGKLDNTHYGYIVPATGTATTGFAGFSTTDNTTALEPASGNIDFTVVVKVGTLSDGTETYLLKFGISDSNTALGNNSINIAYTHGTNSGAWYLQMNTGGSSRATINSSTTVAANTWYTLRFTMTGASQALELFINGASAGTATPSATFAAGTGVGIVNTIVKSAGTTSRSYTHDYIRCIQTVSR